MLDYPKLVGGCSCSGASVEWLLLPLTESLGRREDGRGGKREVYRRGPAMTAAVSLQNRQNCRLEMSAHIDAIVLDVSAMRPQIILAPFILGDK